MLKQDGLLNFLEIAREDEKYERLFKEALKSGKFANVPDENAEKEAEEKA